MMIWYLKLVNILSFLKEKWVSSIRSCSIRSSKYTLLNWLIGIRYNIPELINSKYSQDLVPFIPIPLIKDEIHIFFTVTTAILFMNNSITTRRLYSDIYSVYIALFLWTPSKPGIVQSAISEKVILFVKALMKEQLYEYALIIMKSNLRMVSVVFKNSFDLYDAINFASYIKTSNSFVDFILILNSIKDILLKSILIAGGILQKFRKFYTGIHFFKSWNCERCCCRVVCKIHSNPDRFWYLQFYIADFKNRSWKKHSRSNNQESWYVESYSFRFWNEETTAKRSQKIMIMGLISISFVLLVRLKNRISKINFIHDSLFSLYSIQLF